MDFFSPQKIAACTPSSEERNGAIDGTFIIDPTKSVLTKGDNAGETWWKAADYYFYGQNITGDPIEGGKNSDVLTGAYNGLLIHGADGSTLVVDENGNSVNTV